MVNLLVYSFKLAKTTPNIKAVLVPKRSYMKNTEENSHRFRRTSYEIKANKIELNKPKTSQTNRHNKVSFNKISKKTARLQK